MNTSFCSPNFIICVLQALFRGQMLDPKLLSKRGISNVKPQKNLSYYSNKSSFTCRVILGD